MSSNSNTLFATQQSIKAYVDANVGGGGGSGNYDTGSHLFHMLDNTYDLGSCTKEWRNLYVDGTAYLDSIAGGTISANMTLKFINIIISHTSNFNFQRTVRYEVATKR